MSKKKEEKIDLNKIPQEEQLKYEIAEELGVLDKVLEDGWKSLRNRQDRRLDDQKKKRRKKERRKSGNFLTNVTAGGTIQMYNSINLLSASMLTAQH